MTKLLVAVAVAIFAFVANAASLGVAVYVGDNRCDVYSDKLDIVARVALLGGQISPLPDAETSKASARLVVAVVLGETEDPKGCVAHVEATVRVLARPTTSSGFKNSRSLNKDVVEGLLCADKSLLWGSKTGFADRVATTVEGAIKRCIGSLDY